MRGAVVARGYFGIVGHAALEGSLAARAGKLLVLLERLVELFAVHGHAVLGGKLEGKLYGKAEGVVEPERKAPAHYFLRIAEQVREHLLELVLALYQGLEELFLLAQQVAHDALAILLEFRICRREFSDDHFREPAEEARLDAQLLAVPHRAADKTAQHVTRSNVRRRYPFGVADDEGGSARVIRDDPHGNILERIASVEIA